MKKIDIEFSKDKLLKLNAIKKEINRIDNICCFK